MFSSELRVLTRLRKLMARAGATSSREEASTKKIYKRQVTQYAEIRGSTQKQPKVQQNSSWHKCENTQKCAAVQKNTQPIKIGLVLRISILVVPFRASAGQATAQPSHNRVQGGMRSPGWQALEYRYPRTLICLYGKWC